MAKGGQPKTHLSSEKLEKSPCPAKTDPQSAELHSASKFYGFLGFFGEFSLNLTEFSLNLVKLRPKTGRQTFNFLLKENFWRLLAAKLLNSQTCSNDNF